MAPTDEITSEKHKRQVMDGEKNGELKQDKVKSGKKIKCPRVIDLKTSGSGKRNSEEKEGATEKCRTGEQKEGKWKTKQKKRVEEKEADVTGDGGTPGEKRARRGSGDEKGQDVKESQVIKKSRGQEDTKQNVRVWSMPYSSTVDQSGGDKNIKQGAHRQERDEVDKCSLVQNLSMHRETDRKQCREERDQRDESSDGDQYVSWVQCSKPECGRWRRLKDGVDPSVLPDDWTCQNNTDPTFSSCSAPEEKSNVSEEEMFFYSLVPGSLVWARQSGYPWWPAIVERDPNTEEYLEFRRESDLTPYKCHVTYFGEPVTRAWVICSRVRDYADLSVNQPLHYIDKDLKDSIYMAKEALKLSLKERLMKFGFCSRYISDRESSEDSDIAEILELLCGKAGNDCSDEDSWTIKRRSARRQLKERKTVRKRSGWRKKGNEMYREVEKEKKIVKKKLKEGKEEGKEKKYLTPSFSLPKKKKQHRTEIADQTMPQSAMETSTDMTFDLDVHFEGDKLERKSERVQRGAEEKERRAGEGRKDKDEDDKEFNDVSDSEETDKFSLILLEEE